MPRRNKPKSSRYRPPAKGCGGKVSYSSRDHAPKGVPVVLCKTCSKFHPAKPGKRRG